MTRAAEPDRKRELAELVADHFIATGNARDSLRDVAVAVDSSARMLLHYFDSRADLVRAALEVARARQLAAADRYLVPGPDVRVVLDSVWNWYSSKETRLFFRLFNDVAATEHSVPKEERVFGKRFSNEWKPRFTAIFEADPRLVGKATTLADLVVALIRGLALDVAQGANIKDQKGAYFALVDLILDR